MLHRHGRTAAAEPDSAQPSLPTAADRQPATSGATRRRPCYRSPCRPPLTPPRARPYRPRSGPTSPDLARTGLPPLLRPWCSPHRPHGHRTRRRTPRPPPRRPSSAAGSTASRASRRCSRRPPRTREEGPPPPATTRGCAWRWRGGGVGGRRGGASQVVARVAPLGATRTREPKRVIHEALRLASIVPVMFRRAIEDVHIKGYTIPKGSKIMISPAAAHLNPSIYKDPHVFNPRRWQAS